MSSPNEANLDARLKELDRSIAELQKERQEILRSKEALRRPTTTSSAEATPPHSDKAVERAMNMLEWRTFKKREGEWTFMRDMKGNLAEDLQGVVGFIDELRKGRQVVVGKYRYSASEDKFLNRYPI